jgi:hypothetical protein
MRKRVLSIRLAEPEYQSIKAAADAAGTSVPVHVRRLALDSIQMEPRLAAIETAMAALPDRAALVEVARRLAERIDRAAASVKGGAA